MGTIPEEGVLYDYNVRRDEFHVYILHQGQLWPLNASVQSLGFDDVSVAKALHTTPQSLGFVTGFRSLRTGDYVPKITRPEGQLIIPFSTLDYSESYELVMGTLGKDSSCRTGFREATSLRNTNVPPPRAIYTKVNSQRESERESINTPFQPADDILKDQLLEKINELQRQVLSLQIGHAEVGRKLEGALQNETSEQSINEFDQSGMLHPTGLAPSITSKSNSPQTTPPTPSPMDNKSIPHLTPQTLPSSALFQPYPLPPVFHSNTNVPYSYAPQYPPSYQASYGTSQVPLANTISPYQPRPSSPIDPASWTRRVQSIEGSPTYYTPQQYAHPTNYRDYMYHA